jgi:uncharacterized membrane protein
MQRIKLVLKYIFAILFVLAGLNHFINSDFYVSIMPPYLPWHLGLVYVSGLFEIGLGILLLVPKFVTLAAWGLIGLLIAVFPANLHMAMNPALYPTFGVTALWFRLPLQLVLIAWAYWYTSSSPQTRGR